MTRSTATALGFRVKTGWAAAVLLAGPADAPRVLDSRRVDLCDPAEPDARQPYHAGFGTFQEDDAEVRRQVERVRRFAQRSIVALLREHAAAGRAPRASAVVAGSDIDPAKIANLHMRAHALEGRLYRDLVAAGLRDAGVGCALFVERDLLAAAAKELGQSEEGLRRAAAALGKPDGKPLPGGWRAEEKAAAIAAWLVLAGRRQRTAPARRAR